MIVCSTCWLPCFSGSLFLCIHRWRDIIRQPLCHSCPEQLPALLLFCLLPLQWYILPPTVKIDALYPPAGHQDNIQKDRRNQQAAIPAFHAFNTARYAPDERMMLVEALSSSLFWSQHGSLYLKLCMKHTANQGLIDLLIVVNKCLALLLPLCSLQISTVVHPSKEMGTELLVIAVVCCQLIISPWPVHLLTCTEHTIRQN